jgi:hypothetical protein
MRKLALAAALLVVGFSSAATAQSPGVVMPGDKGRWHGYMPSGYIGAHPSNKRVHSCTWSATAACAAWRNGVYENGGIKHQVVKHFPNGRYSLHVYRGNTRVK